MKLFRVALLLLAPVVLHAQTETFDIITYQAPVGWKKTVADFAVSYSKVDNASGDWCQIGIYKSVASSGNAAADFSSEWKALVKTETYSGAVEPSPTSTSSNGWTFNIGQSKFKWQEKDSYVMLLNISGYGVMATIHISTNTDKYFNEIQTLTKDLQIRKPKQAEQPAQQVVQQNNQPTTTVTNMTPASNTSKVIAVTDVRGKDGITLAKTNFDDGWVAEPFADYVKVAKGAVTVRLHYAIAIDDEMRAAGNMAADVWDRLMASRYRANNLMAFKNEPYTYIMTWFVEGDAIEISTGKSVHVGLRVLVNNGSATPIEIVAPNASAFQQEFPNHEEMAAMVNYNKFAVSASDLVGTWEESSSSSLDYYSTVTGGYVGSNAVAMASSWTWKADGSYDSGHKGASGMVGSMKGYDQKYHGKWTLTPWDVTMTNRFEGKTDVYFCQYEAVRGGRLLVLQDKAAVAMIYRVVKTK